MSERAPTVGAGAGAFDESVTATPLDERGRGGPTRGAPAGGVGAADLGGLRVLVVDDDPRYLRTLARELGEAGLTVVTAPSATAAVDTLKRTPIDVALVDLHMPGVGGLELLQTLRGRFPELEVVVCTGMPTVPTAVEAIRRGAVDFIEKPFTFAAAEPALRRGAEHRRDSGVAARRRDASRGRFALQTMIGAAPAMQSVFGIISRAAQTDSTVLITGESGTGKELVARAIHHGGPRAAEHFSPIDCSALNANLIESELFGHVRGAFTDAHRPKDGLLVAAGNGTVFLDEIGEVPIGVQSKLLRAIQERRVRPVGGSEERRFEARIIAATNRDLRAEVKRGAFREDLFFRLNVISLHVPPLRERRADIPLLVDHFIKRFNKPERELSGVEPEALSRLVEYGWPGNVRELENCIERAFALGQRPWLALEDLPERVSVGGAARTRAGARPTPAVAVDAEPDATRARALAGRATPSSRDSGPGAPAGATAEPPGVRLAPPRAPASGPDDAAHVPAARTRLLDAEPAGGLDTRASDGASGPAASGATRSAEPRRGARTTDGGPRPDGRAGAPAELAEASTPSRLGPVRPLRDLEREAIVHALAVANGSRKEAARLLGIGRSTLYRKVDEYGLAPEGEAGSEREASAEAGSAGAESAVTRADEPGRDAPSATLGSAARAPSSTPHPAATAPPSPASAPADVPHAT